MNSRFSAGMQAGRSLTFVGAPIPLVTPEGVQHLQLPEGSAFSVLSTRGEGVRHKERRALDSYPNQHLVYLAADDAVVDDIHPVLLKWAVRRSDLIILWACDAYAATIAEVEAMLPKRKRVLMVMAACDAEADWFDRVNRLAPRPTQVMRLLCDPLNVPGTVRNAGTMPRPDVLH